MSICIYCGRDTGDTNHRLIDISFTTGSNFKEIWERRSEKWKCLATDKTYFGSVSDKATKEAQIDYSNRSQIFWLDLFINTHPEDARHLKDRGKIRLEMGEFKRAIDDFSDALKFSPNDGEIYYLRGEANKNLGKPDLAERDNAMAARKGFCLPE